MSRPAIYLAGPVQFAEDGGHGWREYVAREFRSRIDPVSPLDKYDATMDELVITGGTRGPAPDDAPETVRVAEIVEADKEMIRRSDGVLVRWDTIPSAGTPMEVHLAHELGLPVAVWYVGDRAISPWMDYHADYVTEASEDAVDWLAAEAGQEVTADV